MPLHTLAKIIRHKKRRGRGIGSRGVTSGRGTKGQKARAGYSRKLGFEGGQTPLYMRLPKERGSKQKFPSQVIKPATVNLAQLAFFPEDTQVDPAALKKAGFVHRSAHFVKLVGNNELKKKVNVRVHFITEKAKKRIEEKGGTVKVISHLEV